MEQRTARHATPSAPSPMELLEPVLDPLTRALSPDQLAAQASMSRGRFAVTQCTSIIGLLLVLLIITAYGFITLDNFQQAILALLIAKNQTDSSNLP
jgi:hypothetical protein